MEHVVGPGCLQGIPLQLIEEDRRARELLEQKRKRRKAGDLPWIGVKRSHASLKNGKPHPREGATTGGHRTSDLAGVEC